MDEPRRGTARTGGAARDRGSRRDDAPSGGASRGVSTTKPPSGHASPSHDTRRRRRPPYARYLAAILDAGPPWRCWGASPDGRRLTLTVLAGPDAWDRARDYLASGASAVVAPPGEDPSGYDWRLLAGHPPVLLRGNVPQAELGRLAAAILRDGAGRVLHPQTGARYVAGGAHG